MSEFQPEPFLTLDQPATLALLAQGIEALPDSLAKYRVKSTWLCTLLNEREKVDGYQYNAKFQAWFERQFSLGPYHENNSVLSILIYNAQRYRRHDAMIEDGWTPCTPESLQQAFKQGRKLEWLGENIIGGSTIGTLNIREVNGQLYAFPPRKRNPVEVTGRPVRIPRKTIATPETLLLTAQQESTVNLDAR